VTTCWLVGVSSCDGYPKGYGCCGCRACGRAWLPHTLLWRLPPLTGTSTSGSCIAGSANFRALTAAKASDFEMVWSATCSYTHRTRVRCARASSRQPRRYRYVMMGVQGDARSIVGCWVATWTSWFLPTWQEQWCQAWRHGTAEPVVRLRCIFGQPTHRQREDVVPFGFCALLLRGWRVGGGAEASGGEPLAGARAVGGAITATGWRMPKARGRSFRPVVLFCSRILRCHHTSYWAVPAGGQH